MLPKSVKERLCSGLEGLDKRRGVEHLGIDIVSFQPDEDSQQHFDLYFHNTRRRLHRIEANLSADKKIEQETLQMDIEGRHVLFRDKAEGVWHIGQVDQKKRNLLNNSVRDIQAERVVLLSRGKCIVIADAGEGDQYLSYHQLETMHKEGESEFLLGGLASLFSEDMKRITHMQVSSDERYCLVRGTKDQRSKEVVTAVYDLYESERSGQMVNVLGGLVKGDDWQMIASENTGFVLFSPSSKKAYYVN